MSYKIPFNEYGMIRYEHDGHLFAERWEENYQFEDIITYEGYARGRSAAYFFFKGTNDERYYVFLTDFDLMIPFMVKGTVKGKFTFTKRGKNYGIKLLEGRF